MNQKRVMTAPAMQLRASRSLLPHRPAARGRDFALLVAYGVAFAALNWSALPWGGAGFFSLWYPAAGLRFAVLWHRGPRCTPWLMAAELCADWVSGAVPITGPSAFGSSLGALRPGLAYGIAVAAVRVIARRGSGPLTAPPMPLGLAALAAPVLNALLVVPLEVALPVATAPVIRIDLVIALTGLAVGDLLGVLVLAPPLIWLAGAIGARQLPKVSRPCLRPLLEDSMIVGACLLPTIALWRAGLGVQPIPSLLAGAWVGLRHGRAAAWFAILVQTTLFLPWSAASADEARRLELHLGIAAVVVVAWLAGSFSDAQEAARASLQRRDRLLFQAERLKTLRAMSVAVIHEISQPLSTLAIEASHLKHLTSDLDPELRSSAELIDRKARALSEMVRRLRRFGGRDADEPSLVPVEMLVQAARQIVSQEFKAHGCELNTAPVPPDLVVQVQEIELTQAVVNLLRNAAAASSASESTDGVVHFEVRSAGRNVEIAVVNRASPVRPGSGMGVGLIIARTIVEAHGGTLEGVHEGSCVSFVISLPLAGGDND